MNQHDARVREALEQIRNDERLTADLSDDGASVVLAWLEAQIRAADPADEAMFAARVQELRRGVKQVARAHADDPQALIAAAKAAADGIAAGKPALRAAGDAPSSQVPGAAARPASSLTSTSKRDAAKPRARPWAGRSRRKARRRRRS